MKIYATSESKLDRVLKTTKVAMADIGLDFNEKKCAIAHVKRGVLDSRPNSTHVGESQIIESLKEGENYKRLLGCASVCREDGSNSKSDQCKSCG